MTFYIPKNMPIEAISFDELVAHGSKQDGVQLIEGLPKSFSYRNMTCTLVGDWGEGTQCYYVFGADGTANFHLSSYEFLIFYPNGRCSKVLGSTVENDYQAVPPPHPV